jgi:hypothetical protein
LVVGLLVKSQPPATSHVSMRFAIIPCLLLTALAARSEDDEFRVYTEHPRLLLTAQRLRLLKRERERDSPRWRQFEALAKGGSNWPEPGFALALNYAVAGDDAAGKRAVEWALGPGNDLRQLALVYDWCQPMLGPKESAALEQKIHALLGRQPSDAVALQRDKILAWIAIAGDAKHSEEAPLQGLVRQWWRTQYAPALEAGGAALLLPDLYPLLEILHSVRDNLQIDLRDAAPGYFQHLAKYLVMGNYPAPYRAPENEFRIPLYYGDASPDLNRAALARAAGLSQVAYDSNSLENQFLQGWLIQDRFSLMTSFGAPYEFLWANPYQPGLSYFQLPLVFHDENSGALFVRSSWEEDADWFGLLDGQAELFHAGRATVVNQSTSGSAAPKPLQLGEASIVFGRVPFRFSMQGGTILGIALQPSQTYLVETDDEEMQEAATDRAGTLVLQYPSGLTAGVRVHEASAASR